MGADLKLKDNPRVMKIGKFLRKTSLEELRQQWNALMGDMSFVGDRLIVQAEVESIDKVHLVKMILAVVKRKGAY